MVEKIQIALVEDSKEDLDRFLSVLPLCFDDYSAQVELAVFGNGQEFLQLFSGQYDLIFLDIELPDSNGIDIGRAIREKDEKVVIVFVTQMGQYAIHGYDVGATDYILKPFDSKVFEIKMKKIMRIVHQNLSGQTTIVLAGGKHILQSDNIFFVEVFKHDVTYHTTMGDYTVRSPLKEVEASLNKALFFRISNSFLVNIKHISGINGYELLLDNGEKLQISRSKKKDLWDALSRYLGGSV